MGQTDTEMAQAFLTGLLAPIPTDSAIELRIKRNSEPGSRKKYVTSIAEIRAFDFAQDEHVWFGTVLRRREATRGTYEDLTWASCVWADFDKVENKEALVRRLQSGSAAPIPTFIVDSGGGIHAYWRIDRMLDLREPAQVTYVREVVYGLASVLQSDTSVHDPTRVMGLPGTWNNGNGKTKVYDPPRSVHVVSHDAHNRYSVGELAKLRRALPLAKVGAGPSGPPSPAGAPTGVPTVLRVPPRLLPLIEGGFKEGCGYPSRSELDLAVVIAMLNAEHSEDEIRAVFEKADWGVGEKFRDKGSDGPRYLATTIAAAKNWQTEAGSRSAPMGAIRENNGTLEVRREKAWELLCNRAIRATARLQGDVGGYRADVIGDADGEARAVTLSPDTFATNISFKKVVNATGAAWYGSDRDVQFLLPYLEAQNPPMRNAVTKIGWHGKSVIFPNAQLDEEGRLVPNSDYLYLGKLTGARLEDATDWPTLATEIFRLVPTLHTPGAMVPLLGWFSASFAAPMVRHYSSGAFPLLMAFGTPEAGKTTILELFQRLCGRDGALQSSTLTLFANIETIAGSNSLPVVYDEHRANNTGRYRTNLYPVLREAYNGGIMSRGRSDLSVVRFELSAPVAVAGETPFRDPALVDRTIHVKLERADKNPAALAALQALPLHQFAASMYRLVGEGATASLWDRAGSLLPRELVDAAHVRQRLGWQTVAFGLLLVEQYLPDAPTLIAQFQDFRKAPDEDVIKPTMAVVYEAVRVIAELIKAHRLRDGQEFAIKEHNLWIIPPLVLPAVEEYFQRIDTDLPMGREAIMGRMREDAKTVNPMITEYQKPFRVGGRVAKGIAISLDRVSEEMGIPVEYWMHSAVEEGSTL